MVDAVQLEDEITKTLTTVLLDQDDGQDIEGLDSDLISYIAGMLSGTVLEEGSSLGSSGEIHASTEMISKMIDDVLVPFLESVQCPDTLILQTKEEVTSVIIKLCVRNSSSNSTTSTFNSSKDASNNENRKLQQGIVKMSLSSATNGTSTDLWQLDGGAGNSKVVKAMANELIDAHSDKSSMRDKRKLRKANAAADRKALSSKYDTNIDENIGGNGLVSMNVRSLQQQQRDGSGTADKTRDVLVRNVTVSLNNGTTLLESGELKFSYQRRYGLIGENGVGKSTLLKAIADGTSIEQFPTHLRILHVRQEVPTHFTNQMNVLEAVLQSDLERNMLLEREKELQKKLEQHHGVVQPRDGNTTMDTTGSASEANDKENTNDAEGMKSLEKDLKELESIYARLQAMSADSAEARAAMILSGLQFTVPMQQGSISDLSGGWRMRVALAAALFIEPDLLMLDEPSNHLDLEAVLWLESYLVTYKHTLVLVSHDRGFLNEVCTDIIEFKRKKLNYFRGNFDNYVRLRDENIRNSMRLYHAYQEKREHMMAFITRFRANANRAAMVQSRVKAVEKMDAEAPEAVEVDQVWRFSIPNSEPLGPPIIAINDVFFDYRPIKEDGSKKSTSEYLLQGVNFGVDLTSRIAILGANGQGKTTLLNLIMGKLKPIRGTVSINGALRIGHFTQHSSDNFDLKLSAVENLLNMFEEAEDQEMRSFLGKFQIQGNDALKPMMLLSGGQKSRVAFAALAYKKPHVLVIDEGSNHLSMEAVDALVEAIQDFKGGVMIVSHDQYFVSQCCKELWVVHGGIASRFRGDFLEYKSHTAELTQKRVEESVKRISAINS